MVKWKQYFPDEGLVHVVALTGQENESFYDKVYEIAAQIHDPEHMNLLLAKAKKCKEKKVPFKLDAKQAIDKKIMDKYEIDERLGLIGLESFFSVYSVTHMRYKFALKRESEREQQHG